MNKKNSLLLNKYYFDINQPGSYSGVDAINRNLREKGIKINKNEIIDWLRNQEEYTLHKPIRNKFKRNQTIVFGVDDTWQADLVDVQKYSKENNGYKFLLSVIDVFSKYAWVVPLLNKTNPKIIDGFNKIFQERKPIRIHTDQGREFVGNETQKFFKKHNVQFYIIYSEKKAAVVERFNRTLKEKMWRYFTKSRNHKYIDILDKLVSSYNRSYHRSIKSKPIDVNKKNESKIFFNLYGYTNEMGKNENGDIKLQFKLGDLVRITKYKTIFDKGYTPNWTQEMFIITNIILFHQQPVYKIKDRLGEDIKGTFYANELQKVYNNNRNSGFRIEKILKTRTRNKEIEYFVQWLGYPEKFNSWVKNIELL